MLRAHAFGHLHVYEKRLGDLLGHSLTHDYHLPSPDDNPLDF